jgi:hypothetical protein
LKPEIFKLQWPLFGTQLILIYNKKRTIMGQVPPAKLPKWLQKHLRVKLKDFFYAEYDSKTTFINITGVAPWQKW